MNPEFRRNVWLELTPRRVTTMTAVLLLIFFAVGLADRIWAPASVAGILYYVIVVFWGARNAALAVVGEIRDRTWDSQRLSAIGAAEMTWGKLFGATIFNWYGGAICLVVIVASKVAAQGPLAGLIDLVYFVVIGLIAQSVALLTSLLASLRRQSHTRLEVFAYQAAGLIAAVMAFNVWSAADPAGSIWHRKPPTDVIPWWGYEFPSQAFLLVSLALFAGWTLVGCYRAMRLELKMRNGPVVWLAFLAFMGAYVSGFDAWLPKSLPVADTVVLRLALAAITYAVITYAMVFIEPKDRVLYRQIGSELANGRIGAAAAGLQGWMMSHKAAFLFAIALIVWLMRTGHPDAAAVAGSALGFLSRDVAIIVLLQVLPGQRRGDFAAIVALFALYVLAPSILHGLGLAHALVLFYPQASTPIWISPVLAWTEFLIVAGLVVSRISASPKPAVAIA